MGRAIATVLTSVLLISAPTAAEWHFFEAEEDWGRTCFAEIKAEGMLSVGLMGAPGQQLVAYLRSGIGRPSISTSWTVDGMVWTSPGHLSDYSGNHEFDPSPGLISALSTGDDLSIDVENILAYNFPLKGSSAAIKSFEGCFGQVVTKAGGLMMHSVQSAAVPEQSQSSAPTPPVPAPTENKGAGAIVADNALFLPPRYSYLMPDLQYAIALVATTHVGCISIGNATIAPQRTEAAQRPVFQVTCEVQGQIWPYQNVFVRDGMIVEVDPN